VIRAHDGVRAKSVAALAVDIFVSDAFVSVSFDLYSCAVFFYFDKGIGFNKGSLSKNDKVIGLADSRI